MSHPQWQGREFHPIGSCWFLPIAVQKHVCCNGVTLPERIDVGIFWNTPFVIVEKDERNDPRTRSKKPG